MAKKNEETKEYTAVIRESSRELTAKERVMFKDVANAVKMVDFAREARQTDAKAIIDFKDYVIVDVHNDSAENTDYTIYIVVDKNDNKYYTSSDPFFNSFKNIYNEMKDSDEEWGIELNLQPSKKYSGKEILTCSLV